MMCSALSHSSIRYSYSGDCLWWPSPCYCHMPVCLLVWGDIVEKNRHGLCSSLKDYVLSEAARLVLLVWLVGFCFCIGTFLRKLIPMKHIKNTLVLIFHLLSKTHCPYMPCTSAGQWLLWLHLGTLLFMCLTKLLSSFPSCPCSSSIC